MFLRVLRQLRQDLQAKWAAGEFYTESPEASGQLNAEALGRVRQLTQLMEMDYESVSAVLSNSRD
jgi:hypothetical protein